MLESRGGAPVTPPLLEARDLRVSYPRKDGSLIRSSRKEVLEGVSLSLGRGEAVGLVGESGSGKTTLLMALLGLLRPSGGEVLLEGEPLDRARRKGRLRVSALLQPVFQESLQALNPRMRVGDALLEGPDAHGLGPEVFGAATRGGIPAALLEMVWLDPGLASRRPGALSGGERQRVSIARALSVRPAALLLDEPVSALDVSAQAGILDLLEMLREETGVAIFLVSHDLAVVGQSCHRLLVLDRGRIVESGPTREVVTDPADPATVRLISAMPSLPGGTPDTPSAAGSS